MKTNKPPRFLRVLAGLFDLAVIYFLVFLCIVGPIILISNDIMNQNPISSGKIAFAICLLALSLVITFLYLWLTLVSFKGSTLGMKLFHIRYVSTNHETVSTLKLLVNTLIVELCFIVSLGFILFSDLISIVYSKNGTTFVDNLTFLKVDYVPLSKKEAQND